MAATGWLWCNRHVPGTTLVVSGRGASNAGGQPGSTGDPADVIDADHPDGYTMPPDCTAYVDNNTPITTWPTDKFGPMVGFADELVNVLGFADPLVMIVKSEPGSSLAAVSCLEPPPSCTFVAGSPPVPLFAAISVAL